MRHGVVVSILGCHFGGPRFDSLLIHSFHLPKVNDIDISTVVSRGKQRKRESFLGGQIDMQESKEDKQMGIKHFILYYLRLQQD